MHTSAATSVELYARRIARVRAEMKSRDIDALVVSVGFDLPYLVGYHAMPLERLTAQIGRAHV